MRYLTVPAPIAMMDPNTDQPMGHDVPFSSAIRGLFTDARITQQMDVFTAIDLRKALLRASEGDVVELSDEEWNALASIARRPALNPAFVYSAEAFFRAICDAPASDPRPKETQRE